MKIKFYRKLTQNKESIGSKQDQIPWQSIPSTLKVIFFNKYLKEIKNFPPEDYDRKIKN